MSHPRPIPWLIVLLGIGFTAFTAWSFYRAAIGTSNVTDADYYSHGLRYNQTQLEQKAASALGWDAAVRLDGRQLRVVLTDGHQQPVTTAHGILTLLGSAGETLRLPLAEETGGIYHGIIPPGLRGELAAQIDFEHAGGRLSKRLLLALP